MRHSVRWLSVLLFTSAAIPSGARSQTTAADTSARHAMPLLVAVIGGPGLETPTPYLFEANGNIYRTQKRPMVFELEISKTLAASGGKKTFFEYFVAVQPAISVGGNVRYHFLPCLTSDCRRRGVVVDEQRYTSYGVGVTPFGGRVSTALPHRAKFSLSVGVGSVLLNHAIPYDRAKSFNFQITARPALGIPIRHHGTLWAGYEFFHMSNANTSPINPGINAGLAMFGFQKDR